MADCSNTPTPESTSDFDLDSRCFSEVMTSNADYTTSKASDGNAKKTFAAALREAGQQHVGEWSTNPEVTSANQVIPYSGTNQLFRPLSLPYQVDSATHPDPNALLPDPSTGYAGELDDVTRYISSSELEGLVSQLDHNILQARDAGSSHPATAITMSSGKSVEQAIAEIPDSIDPAGTAQKLIDLHNEDPQAHPELRTFVSSEADRAEAAANTAASNAKIFSSTADGIAGTSSGEFFWVVSSSGKYVLDLYKNNAGVAEYQNKSTGDYLKFVEVSNVAKNQNYSDASNIIYRNATGSVSNNILTFTTSSAFGQAYQTYAIQANHKYYVAERALSNNSDSYMDAYIPSTGTQLGKRNSNGMGAFDYLDLIIENDEDVTIELRFVEPTSGISIQIKETVIIDLTETYGAGYEPDIETFRAFLSEHNQNSMFFTGTTVEGQKGYKPESGNYFVDLDGDNLVVIQKFSKTQDLKLTFNRFFPNYIWNLESVWLLTSAGSMPSTTLIGGSKLIEFGTDTLGPYRVKAVNNIDGDLPASSDFTGGSHGYLNNYNNVPANTPTAVSNSVGFKVNGAHVTSFTGYCDTVEVNWNNSIQATNTKKSDGSGRYVLAEDYSMFFDGTKFNVNCMISALEDVTIERYYGIQMQLLSIFDDEVFYHSSTNESWNAATGTASDAGSLTCDKITLNSGSTYLDMSLDNTGLGKIQKLNGVAYNAFVSAYNKAYFNLIRDTSFDSGTILTYSGSYKFYGK